MTLKIESPETIRFTLTATYSLAEWMKLQSILAGSSHHTAIDFWQAIQDLIHQAQTVFMPEGKTV